MQTIWTKHLDRRRWFLAGAAALLLTAGVGYAWLRLTVSEPPATTTCDAVELTVAPGTTASPAELRRGICRTLDALPRAWDAADAQAYGDRFTEDATYVAFTGTVYEGRRDIAAGHAALFAGLLEGTRLDVGYEDIRVSDGGRTAVVLARGDTYGDEPPEHPSKVQTLVLEREAGEWQVSAFANTRRAPVTERVQLLLDPASGPRGEG